MSPFEKLLMLEHADFVANPDPSTYSAPAISVIIVPTKRDMNRAYVGLTRSAIRNMSVAELMAYCEHAYEQANSIAKVAPMPMVQGACIANEL